MNRRIPYSDSCARARFQAFAEYRVRRRPVVRFDSLHDTFFQLQADSESALAPVGSTIPQIGSIALAQLFTKVQAEASSARYCGKEGLEQTALRGFGYSITKVDDIEVAKIVGGARTDRQMCFELYGFKFGVSQRIVEQIIEYPLQLFLISGN